MIKDKEKHENTESENVFSDLLKKLKDFANNNLSGSNDKPHGNSKSEKIEKRGISQAVIWLCIIAIVILFAIRMFGAGGEKQEIKSELSDKGHDMSVDDSTYAGSMELSLKEILEKIDGAGNVSVRIYIDSTTEKILAENSKSESEVKENDNEKIESNTSEKSTVISSSGGGISSSGSPYVVQEKLPYPIGVVVVADGAKNERIRTEMYEAVKALYGLSANRIKITY